jgi:membrane-bound metal-dependent hydrolase YbcI (DUF457 family)
MMGRTHTVVTAVGLYCSMVDPLIAIVGALAASLPDQAEKYVPFCKHRGVTHWLLLWGGLTALLFYPAYFGCGWIIPGCTAWKIAAGIILGGFSHVLQDALSLQGVPIVAGIRFRMSLYSTGTFSEYVVAALLCFGFVLHYIQRYPGIWLA